jgi:prophage antirepressor-like protein
MSDVTPFEFESHTVRVVVLDGEPWFVVMDVCQALTIVDARRAASRIEEADRRRTPIRSGDQDRQTWVVNESGLYELIFASNKPEARQFRRWVTREVLPQIRQTGSYSATTRDDLDLLEDMIKVVRADRARVARVEREQIRISSRQEAQDEILDDLMSTVGAHNGDIDILDGRVGALEENYERVTAIGFANIRKIRSDVEFLRQLGVQASLIARRDGIPPSRAHSTVWGSVNAWPLEVWDEAYNTLTRKFGTNR